MAQKSQDNKNTKSKSRQRPALALLLVVLIAAAFFIMSDVPFVKSARDSLMQKLGYEAIDQENDDETGGTEDGGGENNSVKTAEWDAAADIDPSDLPEYNGEHYVKVSNGIPVFPDEVYERAGLVKDGDDWKTKGNLLGTVDSNKLTPYEYYGSLDNLGRCTGAYGLLGEETMPQNGQ